MLFDVCQVLDIGEAHVASRRLDDEDKDRFSIPTPGGAQEAIVVNESGLYTLILTSRKPEAKRFKRWVTAEVIPAIRKTGRYGGQDPMVALNDPATMRALLLGYTEKVLMLEGRVSDLQPKATALDRIATSEGSLCITDAAKTLQIAPKKLFSYMREHMWIYRRIGSGGDVGRQEKINSGMLEHKTSTMPRLDGTERTLTQVRVTPKGLARIAMVFPAQTALGIDTP